MLSQNLVAVMSATTAARHQRGVKPLADVASGGHVDLAGRRNRDRLGVSRDHGLSINHGGYSLLGSRDPGPELGQLNAQRLGS
jgi:hypothetical protein